MVVTDHAEFAEKMRSFRNHGISSDHHQRELQGTWHYAMMDLGFNYRISDMQCALGISQLKNFPEGLRRRREIARMYESVLAKIEGVMPLRVADGVLHAYHLYVVKIKEKNGRGKVFDKMRAAHIGVNVHYLPVHLHPFYQQRFETFVGQCPRAEAVYGKILSLPMHSGLSDDDVMRVVEALQKALK